MNRLRGHSASNGDSVEKIIGNIVRVCCQTTDVRIIDKVTEKAIEYSRLCTTKHLSIGKVSLIKDHYHRVMQSL
jgi:hypothetical protein